MEIRSADSSVSEGKLNLIDRLGIFSFLYDKKKRRKNFFKMI